MKRLIILTLSLLALFTLPDIACAKATGLPALTVTNSGQGQTYSVTLQILFMMTLLSVAPAILMTMTAFTRIIIVLSILRQAIGMATTPTNQILIGIALFMTFFIMNPIITQVNTNAVQPYLNDKISATQALDIAQAPIKKFMIHQTRENDLSMFAQLAGNTNYNSVEEVPLTILMPAFLTSELKTAFQIGFLLFLPFLIIDLVVASVLMSMGMMMLSPLIISLPFKIMMFVLVDGWTLVLGSVAASFS